MTLKISQKEQDTFEQVQEEVRAIANNSSTEVEFISQVAEISQVKKVFSSSQSASGGITFSIVIDSPPNKNRTATIKKRF